MKTVATLLKLLSVFVGLPIILFGIGYLWDEGYLGFYWDRYDSLYDPKLKVHRCIGDNGELSEDMEPPCLVLTLRGQRAQERRAKQCEEAGGDREGCSTESYSWLYSTQPGAKNKFSP